MIEKQFAANLPQLKPPLDQPGIKVSQVTAVGHAGILRQALFQPEGFEKTINQRMVDGRHTGAMAVIESGLVFHTLVMYDQWHALKDTR
jgi:hypothetical protein